MPCAAGCCWLLLAAAADHFRGGVRPASRIRGPTGLIDIDQQGRDRPEHQPAARRRAGAADAVLPPPLLGMHFGDGLCSAVPATRTQRNTARLAGWPQHGDRIGMAKCDEEDTGGSKVDGCGWVGDTEVLTFSVAEVNHQPAAAPVISCLLLQLIYTSTTSVRQLLKLSTEDESNQPFSLDRLNLKNGPGSTECPGATSAPRYRLTGLRIQVRLKLTNIRVGGSNTSASPPASFQQSGLVIYECCDVAKQH